MRFEKNITIHLHAPLAFSIKAPRVFMCRHADIRQYSLNYKR